MSGELTKSDLCCSECLKGVKHFDDTGTDGLARNPRLVLFGVHPALLDDVESNVDNVAVGHGEVGAPRKCGAGERDGTRVPNPLVGYHSVAMHC
jgi:hypothetical protein